MHGQICVYKSVTRIEFFWPLQSDLYWCKKFDLTLKDAKMHFGRLITELFSSSVTAILRKLKQQSRDNVEDKSPKLLKALREVRMVTGAAPAPKRSASLNVHTTGLLEISLQVLICIINRCLSRRMRIIHWNSYCEISTVLWFSSV